MVSIVYPYSDVLKIMAAQIFNPYAEEKLYRNQNNKNKGNLMLLSDFLGLAYNATSISGVVISIEVSFMLDIQTLTIFLLCNIYSS